MQFDLEQLKQPNLEHLQILMRGVNFWNDWREENENVEPNLRQAQLQNVDLSGVDLSATYLTGANLAGANLSSANLYYAQLGGANLNYANLRGTDLRGAYLSATGFLGADLREADLSHANLIMATLGVALLNKANLGRAFLHKAWLAGADLREANLTAAFLMGANLSKANLSSSKLMGANLFSADLSEADLQGADLSAAQLIETKFCGANLTGCTIYGTSVWGVDLDKADQQNLIITPEDQPTITIDNLEVGQFIYLLLNNQKIREVINTITSKAVLILGRFTPERKAVLDAIREELRKKNYLPILFDFDIPSGRDVTETVTLLARMARFIIADLTEPSSIPKELEAIVPTLAVPVQPLIEGLDEAIRPYSMFRDYWKYDWVLQVHRYCGLDELLSSLQQSVISPAERKVVELGKKKASLNS